MRELSFMLSSSLVQNMVRGATRQSQGGKIKWVLLLIFVVVIWFAVKLGMAYLQQEPEETQAQETKEVVEYKPVVIDADYTYTVQEGDVLSNIFSGFEIPFSEIVALEQAESDVFDFTNIQVGKDVHFSVHEGEADFRLDKVVYQPDSERIVKATQTHGGWVIEEEPIPYEIKVDTAKGDVDVSLYASGLAAGLDDKAILAFADVFAWDVDFYRQTRSGDTFKVIYESKYLGDERVTTGRVLAAEYVNGGATYQVFYYKGLGEEKGAYYTEEGDSVQRSFLKVPANFRYVSSGFSGARFHPVVGTVMAHNGVDYPAPTGTPILAVGDGVVTYRRWHSAYGNQIEVRHSGTYSSQYAHMSSFGDYQVGDKVKQGDVIGYVGSTGWSTGPHLHFSMTKYGQYVDPATVDAPAGDPVAEEYKNDYLEKAKTLKNQLDSL